MIKEIVLGIDHIVTLADRIRNDCCDPRNGNFRRFSINEASLVKSNRPSFSNLSSSLSRCAKFPWPFVPLKSRRRVLFSRLEGPKTRARSCIVTFHSKSSGDVGQTVLFSFSTGRKPVYIDIPPNVDFEIVDIFRCGLLSIVSIHLYFFK